MARPAVSKRRKPMSRDRVLRTAIGLADKEGIDALTMRRLAQELGVEAMTLYHYVDNKEEILGGMIDLVAREVPLPDAGADADGSGEWKAATRHRAIATREVLLRHPWAGALWNQVRVGPGRIGYMDAALRTFREGGLSPEVTERAFHAVENHILGYTLQAQAFLLPDEDLAAAGQAFLLTLPNRRVPMARRARRSAPGKRHPRRGRLRVRARPDPGRRGAHGRGLGQQTDAQAKAEEVLSRPSDVLQYAHNRAHWQRNLPNGTRSHQPHAPGGAPR